jgi:D-isomer specific 2-hydroxyacid dehydrogenase-like protein
MPYSPSIPLEVTRSLLERARTARFEFGDHTALVAVQHMLQQTVDLFNTANAMGMRPENIFALGKVYSNSPPVIDTLRRMGVNIVGTTTPEPGEFHRYFEQDVRRLWQVAAEQFANRGIKRVLVLDDGGLCITNVPDEVFARYELCGVEQTSMGMFRFQEKAPRCAVISWARTAVKLEIGGPIFSRCFLDRLNTEFLGYKTLQGKQLGIIGMGSIGRALAKLALKQGASVLYYDPDPYLHIGSTLRSRIIRVESLEQLMIWCEYVAGCSGRNPFRDKWPLRHKPGIKLFSASGEDQEFGPIIADLKNKPDFKVEPHTWNISSEYGPSGAIQIAYLGYPYNFVSRASEAAPTRIVQVETGGLLAALIQARFYLQLCERKLADNHGIHAVSSSAQRFVYEEWRRAMRKWNVDIVEQFGYDRAMLDVARHDDWFMENTEQLPVNVLDRRMARFVRSDSESAIGLEREAKTNFGSVRR